MGYRDNLGLPAGVEPAALRVEASCSNPLSYGRMAPGPGLEPGHAALTVRCSAIKLARNIGSGGEGRTHDNRSQSPMPYHLATPLKVVALTGLEPAITGLKVQCLNHLATTPGRLRLFRQVRAAIAVGIVSMPECHARIMPHCREGVN